MPSSPRPLVSICVPTYNRGRYLKEAIESALAQSFADFELLVVDNCSTDDTAAVATSYAARDSRVRYVCNERNLGMVGNFNRCVALAQGEYVALLHDDDAYLPDMLAAMVGALEAHPTAAFAYGAATEVDDDGRTVGLRRWRVGDAFLEAPAAFAHLLAFNSVPPPAILVRASAYAAVGGYDPNIGPAIDWDLWLRMASRYAIVYVDQIVAKYRLTAESCTTEVEGNGSLAVSLRTTVERALAASTRRSRPPGRYVRRARRWVGSYELSVASLFLYRGDLPAFRQHALAALRFAPLLLAAKPGMATVILYLASLAGERGLRAIWQVQAHLAHILPLGRDPAAAGAARPAPAQRGDPAAPAGMVGAVPPGS